MSISLTRRDAIKGAMAAGAALAAAPYLLNLTGGVETSAITKNPSRSKRSSAAAVTGGSSPSGAADAGTTVLVIKGNMVKSYSGFQSVTVQDAALAAKLKSAVAREVRVR